MQASPEQRKMEEFLNPSKGEAWKLALGNGTGRNTKEYEKRRLVGEAVDKPAAKIYYIIDYNIINRL